MEAWLIIEIDLRCLRIAMTRSCSLAGDIKPIACLTRSPARYDPQTASSLHQSPLNHIETRTVSNYFA